MSIDTVVRSATKLEWVMRFADFYPRYLAEHSNRACLRLHTMLTGKVRF